MNYNRLFAGGLISLFIIAGVSCGNNKDDIKSDSLQSAIAETEEWHSRAVNTAEGPGSGPYSNARIRVGNIGRLADVFNDSNYRHYAYAEKLGINPISSLGEAYFTKRPLVRIVSNEFYQVDSLTHSVPYLVPEAAALLEHIGKAFIDSLASRGASGYKIKVTSLLRTPQSVKRLRRVNRNASDSSTHQFATTFDLSWTNFVCADSSRTINAGDLKNLLGEVLLDARREGRCLVKFERKSACYHITACK